MSDKTADMLAAARLPLSTQMLHGKDAFRAVGRLVLGGNKTGDLGTSIQIGGIIASPEVPSDIEAWEIMECEIIIIPLKHWRKKDLKDLFRGYRLDQVMMSGILTDPEGYINHDRD